MKKVIHFIFTLSTMVVLTLSLNTDDLFSQNAFFTQEEIEESIDFEDEFPSFKKSITKSKLKYSGFGMFPNVSTSHVELSYLNFHHFPSRNISARSQLPKYLLYCCLKLDC